MKAIICIISIFFALLISPFNRKVDKSNIMEQPGDTITLAPQQIQLMHFIGKNMELKPKVINSNSDFIQFFHFNPSSVHINFSNKTLLFFPTTCGGCKEPDYKRTVKIIGNIVIYHIYIIQHGPCKVLLFNYNEVLIPKIKKGDIVKFKVTHELKPQ